MSRTILLADDSLTIQKVVELTFADTEYEVVAVSSGDELLQRLSEVRPQLVICDVIMPGRDGYDVCQEIKSSPEHLHMPVILLTGTFEPFDRDRAIAVGCSEIITKPFEAKKLVDAVERLTAAPSGPPPAAVDTQSIGPEDLSAPDTDDELDDTEVSQEFGPGEAVAEVGAEGETAASRGDEAMAEVGTEEDTAAPPGDEATADLPSVDMSPELPQDELEFGDDVGPLEMEDTELPDVEAPPDFELDTDLTPDPAATLSAEEFEAMMGTQRTEAISIGDQEFVAEPIISEGQEGEPFPTDAEVVADESGDEAGDDISLTTPIDVGAAMAESQPEAEQPAVEREKETGSEASDDADTQDFGDKPPAAEPVQEKEGVSLSDEDVDRIARRLLELATDRIEHIAWDVIPDMAEVVVRERVREIEAEAERKPS